LETSSTDAQERKLMTGLSGPLLDNGPTTSCNAKMAITLTNLGKSGPRLSDKLINKRYINDRRPGIRIFPDTSRLKIGRHSLTNRLEMLKKVKFNWTKGISSDLLHVNLKKTFFTY